MMSNLTTQHRAKLVLALVLLFLAPFLMAPGCGRPPILVHNGESIQDAVDRALPGDTILVLPGTYTGTPGNESVVDVQTSGIRIVGSRNAVIDATGFEYGIMVGPDAPIVPSGCPPIAVHGFELRGLTIKNSDETGIRLVAVDGFELSRTRYVDNFEYGPFPICSRNGLISLNHVSGSNDAGIYVGDDHSVDVLDNTVTDNVAGIEIENSVDSVVAGNVVTGNTAGVLVFVLPGLPQPFTEAVLVEGNEIVDNNRPNTGSGIVGTVPVGSGVLIIGADNVTVRNNQINDNDSFGLAAIGNPFVLFDPRIEPFVDGMRVEGNTILGNGANPDPVNSLTPGADIVFIPDVIDLNTGTLIIVDPDPTDNCFTGNAFDTDFPPGVVGLFPCP